MPELPEVETIVRGLRPHLVGRRIENAEFFWAKTVVGSPLRTAQRLRGARIAEIRRWGKYIVFDLQGGGKPSCLVIHLRMTGKLVVNAEPGPFTRAVLSIEGGGALVFDDVRKFGKWQWSRRLPARLRELGPEPLEISAEEFAVRLRARSAQVKALLLNQEFLRGLGNIYVDESLFRARIHPKTNSRRIGPQRARRLHAAIQQVLKEAIALGGSTLSDFVDAEGRAGYFQLRTAVYGRKGEPCKRCGAAIRRAVVAGRGTHFCARCQRR